MVDSATTVSCEGGEEGGGGGKDGDQSSLVDLSSVDNNVEQGQGTSEYLASEISNSGVAPIFNQNELHSEMSSTAASVSSIPASPCQVLANQTRDNGEDSRACLSPLPSVQLRHERTKEFRHPQEAVQINDALHYLDQVKERFRDRSDVYISFLEIMKDFKTQNIDTDRVIDRVGELFKGFPDLVDGFNVFLPEEHRLPNGPVSPCPPALPPATPVVQPPPIQVHLTQQAHCHWTTVYINDRAVAQVPLQGPNMAPFSVAPMTPNRPQQLYYPQHLQGGFNHHEGAGALVPFQPHDQMHDYAARMSVRHGSDEHSSMQQFDINRSQQLSRDSFDTAEYNQAIDFVNRIKQRLTVEKYQEFLEILHNYRKEHRKYDSPDSGLWTTETENHIYAKVVKLFENHEDLLVEFIDYVPRLQKQIRGASSSSYHDYERRKTALIMNAVRNHKSVNRSTEPTPKTPRSGRGGGRGGAKMNGRRPVVKENRTSKNESETEAPPKKKSRLTKAQKAGKKNTTTSNGSSFFFNKLQTSLPKDSYLQILKLLSLYIDDILTQAELLKYTSDLLHHNTELLTHFKNNIISGGEETTGEPQEYPLVVDAPLNESDSSPIVIELDYSSCRRLGTSYVHVPESFRTLSAKGLSCLGEEVLNTEWVCHPVTTGSSVIAVQKKSITEHLIYQAEEEKFECDWAIRSSDDAIRHFEDILEKVTAVPIKERNNLQLDKNLMDTIHTHAVTRLYGPHASPDIIQGIIDHPAESLPRVIKRLQEKNVEWRKLYKEINAQWKETMEKHYQKSLDYKGQTFKQVDVKDMRPKALITEMQELYEREKQNGNTSCTMNFKYNNLGIVADANKLLLYHTRRQVGIVKADKKRIREVLTEFLPRLFLQPGLDVSDEEEGFSPESKTNEEQIKSSSQEDKNKEEVQENENIETLFYGNQRWYVLIRLHNLLCNRLAEARELAEKQETELNSEVESRQNSPAARLGLLKLDKVENTYNQFLGLVRELLNSNIDNMEYEDKVRELLGVNAYITFTIDKIISHAVSQLQYFGSEEMTRKCMDLFQEVPNVNQFPMLLKLRGTCYRSKVNSSFKRGEFCVKVSIESVSGLMTMTYIDTHRQEGENSPPAPTTNSLSEEVSQQQR